MNIGSAAGAAARAADLMHRGQRPSVIWRLTMLELLEVYEAWYLRGARDAAAELFTEPPIPTGFPLIDAALPAFAEHLANRDDWVAPAWAVPPPVTNNVPLAGRPASHGRHTRPAPSMNDDLDLGLGVA